MPIFRYFVFVGGALLALLFAADYVLPSQPVARAIVTASNDQPLIRIRSDRHLPERVVLDTSQPTIAAPAVKTAAVVAPQPPVQEAASPELAEMSAKARVRETFAQFTPAPKANAAAAREDRRPSRKFRRRLSFPRGRRLRSRLSPSARSPGRTRRRNRAGRMMLVAQQPHFGLFNTTW